MLRRSRLRIRHHYRCGSADFRRPSSGHHQRHHRRITLESHLLMVPVLFRASHRIRQLTYRRRGLNSQFRSHFRSHRPHKCHSASPQPHNNSFRSLLYTLTLPPEALSITIPASRPPHHRHWSQLPVWLLSTLVLTHFRLRCPFHNRTISSRIFPNFRWAPHRSSNSWLLSSRPKRISRESHFPKAGRKHLLTKAIDISSIITKRTPLGTILESTSFCSRNNTFFSSNNNNNSW